MSPTRQRNEDASPRPATAPGRRSAQEPRVSDAELDRLQAKVAGGEPLAIETEAGPLVAELMRATAISEPVTTMTLKATVAEAETMAGRSLTGAEVQDLWVLLQERNLAQAGVALARWRRANDILRASNLLLRRGAHPVDPELQPFLDPEPAVATAPLRVSGDEEPFAENAERGFPPQDPNAESHPELRADVHWTPVSDGSTETAAGRFSPARLRHWMR